MLRKWPSLSLVIASAIAVTCCRGTTHCSTFARPGSRSKRGAARPTRTRRARATCSTCPTSSQRCASQPRPPGHCNLLLRQAKGQAPLLLWKPCRASEDICNRADAQRVLTPQSRCAGGGAGAAARRASKHGPRRQAERSAVGAAAWAAPAGVPQGERGEGRGERRRCAGAGAGVGLRGERGEGPTRGHLALAPPPSHAAAPGPPRRCYTVFAERGTRCSSIPPQWHPPRQYRAAAV